jgi:hypothetical protein
LVPVARFSSCGQTVHVLYEFMPPDKVQLAHAMIEPSEASHALPFLRMPPQWGRVLIQFKVRSVIRSLLSRLANSLKYSLADEDWEAKACQQFFKAASALMHYGAPELTLTAYMQVKDLVKRQPYEKLVWRTMTLSGFPCNQASALIKYTFPHEGSLTGVCLYRTRRVPSLLPNVAPSVVCNGQHRVVALESS